MTIDITHCPNCELGPYYRRRGAICRGHQNHDDASRAHVTYFIRSQQLSFVWDGVHPYVEVAVGGYGEPVFFRIPTEPTQGVIDTVAFAELCRRFAAEHRAIVLAVQG